MKSLTFLMFLCVVLFGGSSEIVIIGGVNDLNMRTMGSGEFRLYLDFAKDLKYNTFISGLRENTDITLAIGWGLEYRIKFTVAPYFGIGGCIHYTKKDGYYDLINYNKTEFLKDGVISYGGYGNVGIRIAFSKNFSVLLEEKAGIKHSSIDYNVFKEAGISFSYFW